MNAAPEGAVKILHIIPRDGIGGVEVAARSMLKRQGLACNFQLLLIAGEGAEPGLNGLITSTYRSALNPLAQLRAVRRIRRERPNVLICSLWRSIPAALLAQLLLPKMRLVYFLHSELVVHFADGLLSRLAISRADAVWSDSAATLERRRIAIRKPRRVISFLTDRRTTPPAESPRPRFTIWARLSREKALERSIRFVANLHSAGIEASFDIWGPDAGAQAELVALVEALGLSNQIRFRGVAARDDLPRIASGHSFYLQLSRFEGMGMAVVEAMQLGLVPVTTAVGEMKRYVKPGETGVIVDTEQPEEAIRLIRVLLEDERAYFAMRRNAIAYWEQAGTYAEDICTAAAALAQGETTQD